MGSVAHNLSKEEIIIISLGGSIIVPRDINVGFLKSFKELILSSDKRFVLICGGGKTARTYQKAAGDISEITDADKDWLGIHATRLNAHLLKTIFGDLVHNKIINDPTEDIDFNGKILIAAGWKPGFSTDYDAVCLAEKLSANIIINLSNTDYVYDTDPKKSSSVTPYKLMVWDELIELVGEVWHPGLNVPFDPIAARKAKELGVSLIVANGTNIQNLKDMLSGNKFEGTIVEG